MNKKVLIITYYWPPSGGGGVQRWLYFTKYLQQLGWDCTVFTVDSEEFPSYDYSLEKHVPDSVKVIRSKIWEPFDLYRKFTRKSKNYRVQASFANQEGGNKRMEKIALWIRSNLFIPDARKFWIKPSIKKLIELHKAENFDAVISSGPPHSCHLIALGLQKKMKINWLADFRDPWTGIDYFENLSLTKNSLKKHQKLELQVLKNANVVTTVGATLAKELEEIAQRKVEVITNGFFEEIAPIESSSDCFTIVYTGTLGPARNHPIFLNALKSIVEKDAYKNQLRVLFFGKPDLSFIEDIKQKGIEDIIEFRDYIPVDELNKELAKANALYLPINNSKNAKGILTGKFFEYLSTQKPILAIGPLDGDVNHILKETQSGFMVDFNDQKGLEALLIQYLNRDFTSTNSEKIKKYSRFEGAKQIDRLIR